MNALVVAFAIVGVCAIVTTLIVLIAAFTVMLKEREK